jgi:CheY-like chemotaxis protein
MKTILLLEDEPLVRNLLRHLLKSYNVIESATAEQALLVLAGGNFTVDLLISDVRLPTISGIQVALGIRSDRPGFPVVLTSGYPAGAWRSSDGADLEQLGSESVVCLQKPFQPQALLNAVYELIGQPDATIAKSA